MFWNKKKLELNDYEKQYKEYETKVFILAQAIRAQVPKIRTKNEALKFYTPDSTEYKETNDEAIALIIELMKIMNQYTSARETMIEYFNENKDKFVTISRERVQPLTARQHVENIIKMWGKK